MLTKEECLNALSFIEESTTDVVDYKSNRCCFNKFEKEIAILEELINEHFDNPPLTHKELFELSLSDENKLIWDNRCKCWGFLNYVTTKEVWYMIESGESDYFEFEENRYFRKQVEE